MFLLDNRFHPLFTLYSPFQLFLISRFCPHGGCFRYRNVKPIVDKYFGFRSETSILFIANSVFARKFVHFHRLLFPGLALHASYSSCRHGLPNQSLFVSLNQHSIVV